MNNSVMLMMQGQGEGKPSSKNEISVKDLGDIFKVGLDAAKGAAPTQQNPIDTINATLKLIEPVYNNSTDAVKATFQSQIDQLKQGQFATKGARVA